MADRDAWDLKATFRCSTGVAGRPSAKRAGRSQDLFLALGEISL